MDTITQGLLGAVTAQLGFRRRIGRDATWLAATAAVVPDLDALVSSLFAGLLTDTEVNDFFMISTHRGLSHSMLFIPLMCLPLAFLWWWFKRKSTNPISFGLLYLCALVGMLSHPLLDWCTTYGTQLFAPLTNHRYAIDAVPIVDIIYTPILILTLVACWLARRGNDRPRRAGLTVGWIGFGLSVAYLAAGYGIQRYLVHRFAPPDAQTAQIIVKAYPQLGTIFAWRITRQTPDAWAAAKVNVLFPNSWARVEWNRTLTESNAWIDQARTISEVKIFEWFTRNQTRTEYAYRDRRHIIEFYDMRYGARPDSLQSIWFVRVTFDELPQLWDVEYIHHYRGMSLPRMIAQTWTDLWTP